MAEGGENMTVSSSSEDSSEVRSSRFSVQDVKHNKRSLEGQYCLASIATKHAV